MSSKRLIIAACVKGDLPQLKCVLEEAELDVGSEPLGSEGETALHVACAYGYLDIVQYLVNDRGCSVAVPNSQRDIPLEVAWANRHWEVVEFLLNAIQGKDLFAEVGLAPTTVTQLQEVAKCGDEALHQACSHGYLEVVKFLICNDYLHLKNEKGRDPTAVSSHGTTPLQVAWENKHWEVALYLIQVMRECPWQVSGLSPTAITQLLKVVAFKEDAFHVACSQGNLEVVQYLHESLKCSLTQQNVQGATPLDMARSYGHLHVIHFLLKRGERSGSDMTELHITCMRQNKEKMKNLVSCNITSLSTPDQYGITAVHDATYQPENLSVLVSIAEQKCMLSLLVRRDDRGNTPLHYAASCGCTRSVRILIPYYESVNIQNSDGDTPLHLSIRSCYCTSDLVREISMHKSCNPSTVNAQNETPLHIALQYGKLNIAELLMMTGKSSQEDIEEAIKAKFLLHQAVASGRLEFMQTLLNVPGCNINQFNSDRNTPLHIACRQCSIEVVQTLLADKRCALNVQNNTGETALHIAVYSELHSVQKVQSILHSDMCDPNITNNEGYTPLHVAVGRKRFKVATLLLMHSKIRPNAQDNDGNTPLHISISKMSLSNAELFLSHDINVQNNIQESTPRQEVVMRETPVDVVQALILHKNCNPNQPNYEGVTPLQLSVNSGEMDYVEVLVTSGKCSHEDIMKATEGTLLLHQAVSSNRPKLLLGLTNTQDCNINKTNCFGETVFHVACRMRCSKAILEILVKESRCDLNAQTQCGDTALHFAVRSEQDVADKVQCILPSERCNPNITNSEGCSPLHVAMSKRDFETAVILLNHSQCNPNIQDLNGNTALHIATAYSKILLLNIESFLNHKNIDLNIQNREGNTPLHEAVMNQVPVDVVEALTLHNSCNPSIANNAGMTSLQISCDIEDLDFAEVLIASGKCKHEEIVKATEDTLLLHQAVYSNRPNLVTRLLNVQYCDINRTNSAGETALHCACKTWHGKAILEKLIEESRCDLNAQNSHGNTALHLAVYSGTDVTEKVQRLLQSERCNPNISNSEGYTPLHVACAHGQLDIVQYLVNNRDCSVTERNFQRATPLEVAWANRFWEGVEFLLKATQGKELFAEVVLTPTTLTQIQEVVDEALHQACIHGYLEVLKLLICSGYLHMMNEGDCKPTAVSSHGTTLLQLAWENKRWEVASYLLQAIKKEPEQVLGLSPTATKELLEMTEFKEDAFHVACSCGSLEVVRYLHESLKCNLMQCNSQGKTPLDMARSYGRLHVIHFLLESGECSAPDMTELHIACLRRDEEEVRNLASDITSLGIPDQYGITAVHYATYQPENLSILTSIAEEKNMLSLLVGMDGRGNTPLHYAASCGSRESVKILVSYYKSVDIQNSNGDTPLHLSIKSSYGKFGPVREILQHESCNPSTVNAQNETPLKTASQYGNLDSAELLILTGKCSPEDIKVAVEGNLLLHQAVATGRLELVQTLLKVPGCNINEFNSDGETPLHVACRGDIAVLQSLAADSRCDLNAQNRTGLTALHISIATMTQKTFDKMLDVLLKHPKCNPNVKNNEGDSALHLAVRKCSTTCATCLLQHDKVDPNIQNHNGNTPLHEIVMTRAPTEIMELLLQHKKFKPCIRNENEKTPLQIASENRLLQYVSIFMLCEKYSKEELRDAVSRFGYILHCAVLYDINVVNILQSLNSDVNEANENGETPLHIACRQGSNGVLQILVADKRCDINIQNSTGETALHIAVYSELHSVQKVQSIQHSEKCNPNIANNEGQTPLHVAARRNNFQIAELLLKSSKVDPNAQDNDGNTPLHISTSKMSLAPSNIESFLNHESIDLSIQNIRGNTPLHEAVISKTPVYVVEGLTFHKSCNPNKKNHDGTTALQLSVDSGRMDYVQVLIASGKCSHEDIEKCTEGSLLLHQAVSSNRSKLALILVAMKEYNINETNSAGETALHVACRTRSSRDILEMLVEDSRCDLNIQNRWGNTALHLALHCEQEAAEKVQCILQSERCNPNITNSEGFTPLHVAVQNKQFQSVAMLLKHSECNPNIQDLSGNTPLHLSIGDMSLSDVEVFLSHKYIDLSIQNNFGDTVLNVAVLNECPLEIVAVLISHKSSNPCITNSKGLTPLQTAVGSQVMGIAALLITSKKCSREVIVKAAEDASLLIYAVFQEKIELIIALIEAGVSINASNPKGETALHIACKKGNSVAVKILLQNGADVLAVDSKGNAPIHVACENMTLECLSILLSHHTCNPNQQNAVGDTPLHLLCTYEASGDMSMIRTLLSIPGIDPECVNHAGQIPADLAQYNYFVIEEISKYLKQKNTQLETYLKIFVVGNSGGGKSTLIKAITSERTKSWKSIFKAEHIKPDEVPPHTAGIVPLRFNSQHFGHAVLYDFAGQHEYYSSHAAVMENLVLPSPPLFLLLIDISKPIDEVREELVYWWMFINNHSKRATAPPHVILVGSHKDIVKERGGNVQRTMEQVTDIVRDIPASFQFDQSMAFPLDCRKLVSQGLTALLTQLKLTCQTLRQTADIDLHCHILKAFLTTKFRSSIACEISDIAERTKSEDVLLPQEPSQLIPLLSTLSDKGHLLLLQNHDDVNKSWVVLKPELLLAEVNGSIFAPDNFKGHCSGFAMSTGVVTLSKIIEKFGKPNNQVIIGYLTHLEFCFRIKDQHTLEMIMKEATLQLTPHGSEHAEEYYFFPALIQKENPSDVCLPQETIKYECGWFYRCNEPTEQLTTRFLHVLILRLAFSCDPPNDPTERESVVLLRRCSVWKHGIAWLTNDGIETIVEVGLQCCWVAVMLRCPDTHKVQCAELRTKVITTVLKTKQDFCPAISMKEFLIAPSSLQYPFEGRELTLYSMREIAKIIIAGKEFFIDTEGKSTIHISQLVPFEPFFNFGENLIDNLFAPGQSKERKISRHNMFQIANKCYKKLDDFLEALQPNPTAFQRECVKPDCTEVDKFVALLQILQRRGCKTWGDFGEEFSSFSIFCGRNPMDLALGREAELRYPYEHHTRPASSVAEREEVTTATAGDQVSTESNDDINVDLSAEKSVKERGNEESRASEQIPVIEKDNVSQEEEREQSIETHSDTEEIKEIQDGKACALNGEMKSFVKSSKYSHTSKENLRGESDGVLCDKLECERNNFAREFWEIEFVDDLNGENVVIAILDSGIQTSHKAFEGRILKEYSRNFCSGAPDAHNVDDTYGHGTRCAGIAVGNQFVYTSSSCTSDQFTFLGGVASKAKLIICKVTQDNSPSFKAVEDALQHICNLHNECHVHVVCMSLGFRCNPPLTLQKKINALSDQGTICVAGAGNDGSKYSRPVLCPASCQNTIAVGSHDQDGEPSKFSAKGGKVCCLALGEKVCAPTINDGKQRDDEALVCSSGTSVAAPAIAGLIALIIQSMIKLDKDDKVHFNTLRSVLEGMAPKDKVLRPSIFFAGVDVKNEHFKAKQQLFFEKFIR